MNTEANDYPYRTYKDYTDSKTVFDEASHSFESLLQAIQGKKKGAESFENEQLVIKFVRCDKDGKELDLK